MGSDSPNLFYEETDMLIRMHEKRRDMLLEEATWHDNRIATLKSERGGVVSDYKRTVSSSTERDYATSKEIGYIVESVFRDLPEDRHHTDDIRIKVKDALGVNRLDTTDKGTHLAWEKQVQGVIEVLHNHNIITRVGRGVYMYVHSSRPPVYKNGSG